MKRKLAKDVFSWLGLRISQFYFRCPYCDKTWERGGHKEGFVKASASRHVYNCWQVGLYLRGYVVGGGDSAITIEDAKARIARGVIHKSYLRLYQAAVAQRRRAGVLDKLMPKEARR